MLAVMTTFSSAHVMGSTSVSSRRSAMRVASCDRRDAGAQHGQLVAAEPGHEVTGPHGVAEPGGDLGQHGVADGVAVLGR